MPHNAIDRNKPPLFYPEALWVPVFWDDEIWDFVSGEEFIQKYGGTKE